MPKETAKSKRTTSKTARVLGLLTSPAPSAAPASDAALDSPSHPNVKLSDDQTVEDQIRNALASELDEFLPPQQEAEPQAPEDPGPVPAPEEPIPEEPVLEEPAEEDPVWEEPVPEEPAGEEPVWEEPAPASVPEAPVQPEPDQEPSISHPRSVTIRAKLDHVPDPDQDFTCFNVMQALVESKAEKYIKLFGLCTCHRCHADVVALSLSNLPAKYLVTSSEEIVPLLSVYEGTYSAAVISQVMNACKKVMMNPRHKR